MYIIDDEVGMDGLEVFLGAAEPDYVEMMAETVTAGDPTYTGPLAGVSLGLPVYHVTEPEVREIADASVYQDQIALSEIAMETEKIWESIRNVRAKNSGA
jgi:glycine reductase